MKMYFAEWLDCLESGEEPQNVKCGWLTTTFYGMVRMTSNSDYILLADKQLEVTENLVTPIDFHEWDIDLFISFLLEAQKRQDTENLIYTKGTRNPLFPNHLHSLADYSNHHAY